MNSLGSVILLRPVAQPYVKFHGVGMETSAVPPTLGHIGQHDLQSQRQHVLWNLTLHF